MEKRYVKSWEDLQANMERILSELERDPNLVLAAAANPLLAVEELGFEIDPNIRDQLEDRLRFPTRDCAQLDSLRSEIFKLAGKKFDIRSPEQLHTVLFEDLGIVAYDEHGCKVRFAPAPFRKRINAPMEKDPLEQLSGLHPVIESLIEFRRIDASAYPFSTQPDYKKIRAGDSRLQARFELHPHLKKRGSDRAKPKDDDSGTSRGGKKNTRS